VRTGWAAVALVLCTAVACSDDGGDDSTAGSSTTTTLPPFDASFSAGPCPVKDPIPERVTCGTVVVPERHADSDGPTIELALALIEPEDATGAAPDPLVLLQGGPGSGFVSALPFLLEDPIVEDRTMVLIDPRGTGDSEPSLACPEVQELDAPLLALDADDPEARTQQHDAVVACHDRLVADGIDLAAFPGLGHGTVRVHDCPLAMARAFLVDPDAPVDDACLAAMPAPAWLP
jgi:hypothetical protein